MGLIKITYDDYEKRTPLLRKIMLANKERRQQIIELAAKERKIRDKVEFLRHYFVADYEYDYKRLDGSSYIREQGNTRTFELGGQIYESFGFSNYLSEPSPTLHLTKLGQCTAYAADIRDILFGRNKISCLEEYRTVRLFDKRTGF